ncbi:MAG: type II secretion system F family protein, partial [bacterium]
MSIQFKYEAIESNGNKHEGTMTAETSEQVLEYLNEKKLIPINIEQIQEKRTIFFLGSSKQSHYEELITFNSNLVTLYKAGIPLLRALSLIKVGSKGSYFNTVIESIRNQIEAGQMLSTAMAQYKNIFSQVYISCIAAGEESGQLDKILDQLNIVLEEEMELTRAIKSGIRYPIIVISAIALAFLVMITFVMPRFISFFDSFGAELPLPTRMMIGVSNIFTHYWPALILTLGTVIFAYIKTVSNPRGKLWLDTKFLKIPIFGNLIIKGNVARFSMMFQILFQSGLPIVKSLDLLVESVRNSAIALEIKIMGVLLKSGRDTEINKSQFEYFPELSLQMITIGLESGSLST